MPDSGAASPAPVPVEPAPTAAVGATAPPTDPAPGGDSFKQLVPRARDFAVRTMSNPQLFKDGAPPPALSASAPVAGPSAPVAGPPLSVAPAVAPSSRPPSEGPDSPVSNNETAAVLPPAAPSAPTAAVTLAAPAVVPVTHTPSEVSETAGSAPPPPKADAAAPAYVPGMSGRGKVSSRGKDSPLNRRTFTVGDGDSKRNSVSGRSEQGGGGSGSGSAPGSTKELTALDQKGDAKAAAGGEKGKAGTAPAPPSTSSSASSTPASTPAPTPAPTPQGGSTPTVGNTPTRAFTDERVRAAAAALTSTDGGAAGSSSGTTPVPAPAAAAAPNIDALAKEWGMQHAMVQLMLDTAGRPPPRTADGGADDALAARLRRAQTAVSEHIERNVRLRRENRELMQQAVASLQATAGVPGLPRANQAAPAPFVAPPARRAVDMGNEAVRPPAVAAPFAAPTAIAVARRPTLEESASNS